MDKRLQCLLEHTCRLPKLLMADQCEAITDLYGDTPAFRSHVVMVRHGFGKGE